MATITVPPRLWIGGIEHEVRFRRGLISGEDAQGQSSGNLAAIEIEPDLSESQRREVFLHECIHRIFYTRGWRQRSDFKPVEEEYAMAMGHALAELCRELGIDMDFSGLRTLA